MGDVRFVCHTHLHIDHAGKDDLFPMNTTVVLNRKELEYSVSGLMHPQYPAPDIKHLIDRLHTKSALRFLDLEITGPIELMPGVYCDAAGAHTEGSMNIHRRDRRRHRHHLRRRDLRFQRPDRRRPSTKSTTAEPRTTGNHGTSKRAEKAAIKRLLSSSRFCCRCTTGPPRSRAARSWGGSTIRSRARSCNRCPHATGSRPERRAEETDR